jgi:glycosyltransferase involved in cell wall biosynthesis
MVRVLIFGTHPKQFNGYSKVIYELIKRVHASKETNGIEIGVFGFQNYDTSNGAQHRPDLPSDIYIYDAFANEEPKNIGFGIEQVKGVVESYKPDVCIVYNDLLIISNCLNKLTEIEDHKSKFKIVAYIDQVYLNQKKVYMDIVNAKADAAILFTEYWKKTIVDQGLTIPTYVLQHGFDSSTHYPVPKAVARAYLGLSADDFLILNLNRNQPRKRWDTCLKALAELILRNPASKIKLIIGTTLQGSWDLVEIFERELKKRGLTLQDGLKHVVVIENPQKLSDHDVNIIYNVADIGINTCDGEGFGLCNFEQAAIGVPQVVPRLGGFQDFFNDDRCNFVEPTLAYYVDTTRDHVCGEALMCAYYDFVTAVEAYYNDRKLLEAHGKACRDYIPKTYAWNKIAQDFVDIIGAVSSPPKKEETFNVIDTSSLSIVDAQKLTVIEEDDDEEVVVPAAEVVIPAAEVVIPDAEVVVPAAGTTEKPKKKAKKSKKKAVASAPVDVQAELALMRQAINMLLQEKAAAATKSG